MVPFLPFFNHPDLCMTHACTRVKFSLMWGAKAEKGKGAIAETAGRPDRQIYARPGPPTTFVQPTRGVTGVPVDVSA